MANGHKLECVKAMLEETKPLHENHTYDLVELHKQRKALINKGVYRLKNEENNPRPTYRARVVVKGFN